MPSTVPAGPDERTQRLRYSFSPRLFFSELLVKQWMEPIIPFTLMIALVLSFSLTIKDYGISRLTPFVDADVRRTGLGRAGYGVFRYFGRH